MNYEVVNDKQYRGEWRVEAIDRRSGDCYVAIFAGPDAEGRAREYAQWKTAGSRTLVGAR